MVFATLFPLGILQLYHSISVSYYDARTLNYISSHTNSILEWMRMPGDVVFILGGALPVLYICARGVFRKGKSGSTKEPGLHLFTERVEQTEGR
jgi:nitric oxide reductase subunit B